MMIGASPNEGSSAISSLGGFTRTLAMESIRCSPPERVPAICDRTAVLGHGAVEWEGPADEATDVMVGQMFTTGEDG